MGRVIPGRSLVLLDLAAVVWIASCVVLALMLSTEVRGLARTGDAVVDVGRQVESVGGTLESLGGVPIIGGDVADAGERVRQAGLSARRSGAEAQASTDALSTLFGLAVVIVPAIPLLLFYLPLRVARARDQAALRRLTARAEDDPELERLLARRALMTLPYRELDALPGRPWGELGRDRREQLAQVEVAREVGDRPMQEARRRAG